VADTNFQNPWLWWPAKMKWQIPHYKPAGSKPPALSFQHGILLGVERLHQTNMLSTLAKSRFTQLTGIVPLR